VNLVAKTEHRTPARYDSYQVPSGAVLTGEKGELLMGLQVAVRTVVRKMPDLRARGRGHKNKRKSAEERLH
jgi:hypothetical protein